MKKLCKLLVIAFSIVFFTASYAAHSSTHPHANVWAAVKSQSDLTTFASAVREAGLVRTLTRTRGITVFAPTNRAFRKLPNGTLQSLLQPKNRSKLRRILLMHMVRGRALSQSIHPGRFKALNGHMVTINERHRRFYYNDIARVSSKDIMARNGTVHVINRVIVPSSRR